MSDSRPVEKAIATRSVAVTLALPFKAGVSSNIASRRVATTDSVGISIRHNATDLVYSPDHPALKGRAKFNATLGVTNLKL